MARMPGRKFAMLVTSIVGVLTIAPTVAQSQSVDVRIAEAVTPYLDNHSLAGAVTLVTDRHRTTQVRTLGFSDLSARKPMDAGTIFWIASMSKPITAVALMMLVDQGKVRLNDPVEKYLRDFRPRILVVGPDGRSVALRQPKTKITIRQLLDHTSGLAFASAIEAWGGDRFQLAVRVRSYALTPLQFEPGSDYQYSSAGITVIGRVVEVVSGMPFDTFLKQELFDPLGMLDTSFVVPSSKLSRVAVSYLADGSELRALEPTRIHQPYDDSRGRFAFPGGGLFSTAEDLARFCRMVLNDGAIGEHRYLSKWAIDEMTRNQVQENALRNAPFRAGEGYGLGWSINGNIVGHGGSGGTNFSVDRTLGRAAIWMVQIKDMTGGSTAARKAFESIAFSK
jgi:CubicO group peptidase (beta-lactamase class C family)